MDPAAYSGNDTKRDNQDNDPPDVRINACEEINDLRTKGLKTAVFDGSAFFKRKTAQPVPGEQDCRHNGEPQHDAWKSKLEQRSAKQSGVFSEICSAVSIHHAKYCTYES